VAGTVVGSVYLRNPISYLAQATPFHRGKKPTLILDGIQEINDNLILLYWLRIEILAHSRR
jgi:hypothetical protein